MGSLVKTRTVLMAQGWVKALGDTERANTELMVFLSGEDEIDETVRSTELHLDGEIWREMGSPNTITLSIEPGDLLNTD